MFVNDALIHSGCNSLLIRALTHVNVQEQSSISSFFLQAFKYICSYRLPCISRNKVKLRNSLSCFGKARPYNFNKAALSFVSCCYMIITLWCLIHQQSLANKTGLLFYLQMQIWLYCTLPYTTKNFPTSSVFRLDLGTCMKEGLLL